MPDQLKAPILLSFSCPVKLQDMEGDDQVRMCSRCACSVQNISDYDSQQLQALQVRIDAGEKICVSFRQPPPRSEIVQSRTPLLPRPIVRISIAVAATITLAYYVPSLTLPVSAEPPVGDGSYRSQCYFGGKKSDAPRRKPLASVARQKPVDTIQLGPNEYGLMAGRPAPSALRDLVIEISYYHEDMLGLLAHSKLEAFKEKADRGEISVPLLESLAQSYAFHGPATQARKCYALLLALADREHPTEAKLKEWNERFVAISAPEYQALFNQFETDRHANKFDKALIDLVSANTIRRSSKDMEAKHPFSEISSRIDLLPPNSDKWPLLTVRTAFSLANQESRSPAIDKWLQPKITLAVSEFDRSLIKADAQINSGRLDDAMKTLIDVFSYGHIDPSIFKACRWTPVKERLLRLSKLSPVHSNQCTALIGFLRDAP